MLNELFSPITKKLPENQRIERIWKLAQTDFKRRYFNAKLGLLWAFINPLFRLFIYYFVFQALGRMRMENFSLYIFSALILWMSFSECTNKSMNVFASKRYLLENIKFNKVDLFYANTISVFLGLSFNIGAYTLISLLMGIPITCHIFWVPIILANLFVLCTGVSMILAAINIYLADLRHLWTMAILLGFWTIPAIFPIENFVGKLRYLLYINPIGGLIVNFRNAILYNRNLEWSFFIYCWLISILLFILGAFLIRKSWKDVLENL